MGKLFDLPPIWLLAHMAAAWLLAKLAPIASWDTGVVKWIGAAFIVDGLLIMAWAGATMMAARTTVMPKSAPTALVTGGPFRLSRNPIYLGDALILCGWAFWLGALSPFLLVPVFMAVIHLRFIRGEEAGLKAAFPDDYAAWAGKVRPWI